MHHREIRPKEISTESPSDSEHVNGQSGGDGRGKRSSDGEEVPIRVNVNGRGRVAPSSNPGRVERASRTRRR